MLVSPSMSPSLGLYMTMPNHVTNRKGFAHCRRERHGAKSAPPQVWHRRNQKNKVQHASAYPAKISRNCSTADNRRVRMRHSASSTGENCDVKLSVDDVLWLAEQTREMTSLESRRSVMEEAQKTIRQETSILDNSRPHSVIGVGLQAMTSPMPLSAKHRYKPGQINHIPVLLSLPSDRTFIPSPDQDHARHMTTPADDNCVLQEERSQSVAKQCCEIMGPSLCRTCRKLESRMLNREQAEKECPRMRITQENITTTQMVKRFYPRLTDSEIQDKIARGEISRMGFPHPKCKYHRRRSNSSSSDDDGNESEEHDSSSEENTIKTENEKQKHKFTCQHVSTLMLELAKLKSKLKNQTSTPLYFTDLKRIQAKIISGEVDRKRYLMKQHKESPRLKSALSSISTASSTKTTLSKLGVRLSESLMPVFVSPRKVKICEEPSYKVYYEPPLLSKRRQIPNPSFFAGSSEAYSLPERLPDIIEFADSKIKLLEKQGRSVSSMSMFSNVSEDYDNLTSERAGESGRSGDNNLSMSNSQRDLKMKAAIQEQYEHESNSFHEEPTKKVNESGQEENEEVRGTVPEAACQGGSEILKDVPTNDLGSSVLKDDLISRQTRQDEQIQGESETDGKCNELENDSNFEVDDGLNSHGEQEGNSGVELKGRQDNGVITNNRDYTASSDESLVVEQKNIKEHKHVSSAMNSNDTHYEGVENVNDPDNDRLDLHNDDSNGGCDSGFDVDDCDNGSKTSVVSLGKLANNFKLVDGSSTYEVEQLIKDDEKVTASVAESDEIDNYLSINNNHAPRTTEQNGCQSLVRNSFVSEDHYNINDDNNKREGGDKTNQSYHCDDDGEDKDDEEDEDDEEEEEGGESEGQRPWQSVYSDD